MFKRLAVITMAVTILAATPAYAGQWLQDSTGWRWQNDNGSYPVWSWAWIDGNHDGVAENYYFDENGYLSYETEDQGMKVDANGAMLYNGAVCTEVMPEGRDYIPGVAVDGKMLYLQADATEVMEKERQREIEERELAAANEITVADIDTGELAELIVDMVNDEREKRGSEPLTVNEELMENAVLRAEEAEEFFSHTRPDGSNYDTAITVKYTDASEILFSSGYGASKHTLEDFALGAVVGWLDSSGHKKNMLNSKWEETGIGVCITETGYSVVQMFIKN